MPRPSKSLQILSLVAGMLVAGCEVKVQQNTPAGGPSTTPVAGEPGKATSGGPAPTAEKLSGEINIDGSSTVAPITTAVAEKFSKVQPNVRVPVGTSGTGGGFKKFIEGASDINNASREISEAEIAQCKEKGIEYVQIKVAIDGLSVVVHPDNDWCKALTTDQLKQLWVSGSKITKWNELDPAWPDAEIKLFGAGTDSGTFDSFTEVICGKKGNSRTDYQPSEDDNFLVQGVAGDKNALGYFGYAYYIENTDKVKAVAIANGSDASTAVAPTQESIESGKYQPLSRPLFLCVNKKAFARKEVAAFLRYYFSDEGLALVSEVGYIRLPAAELEAARKTLEDSLKAGGN
jgi:phosphate transport system substrate-binding protein